MLSTEISFFVVNDFVNEKYFVNDDLVSLKRVLFCMFPFLPLIPPSLKHYIYQSSIYIVIHFLKLSLMRVAHSGAAAERNSFLIDNK